MTFSVCCHPEILLPWQRDILTSPSSVNIQALAAFNNQANLTCFFAGGVTNACIVPRPLYLDSAPTKSSLSPIQPFKRHMYVPVQSRDRQLTGLSSSTVGGESHSDGIPMILRGKLFAEV